MGRHNESSRGHRSDRDDGDSRRRRHHHHRRRHDSDDDRDDTHLASNAGKERSSSSRHHHHRHSRNEGSSSRRRDEEKMDRDGTSRHRRARVERRDGRRTNNHNDDDEDDRDGSISDRSDGAEEHRGERRHHTSRRDRRHNDNDYSDDGETYEDNQRGQKRRRGGRDRDADSDREEAAEGNQRGTFARDSSNDNYNRHSGAAAATAPVDWSSRRGRQRMPTMAYDVGQQTRLLGFLARRDAAGSHTSSVTEMQFKIGADGLVEMPPPNTLVRRSYQRQPHERSRQPPVYNNSGGGNGGVASSEGGAHARDGNKDSDEDSVASHESLYEDPAMAHRGILPDIFPPSNLFRVALYGVELAVTADHLSSLVGQLLGTAATPYRVRRPAREMLEAVATAYSANAAVAAASEASATPRIEAPAPSTSGSGAVLPSRDEGVLADANANDDGVLSSPPSSGVLPDTPAVLADEDAASGVLGSGGADAKNDGAEADNDADEGVLPDAASLPVPPPPAVQAFYLPGLHNVNGPGGMVVLEFTEQEHAVRTVQVLNGGFINGRRVAASM